MLPGYVWMDVVIALALVSAVTVAQTVETKLVINKVRAKRGQCSTSLDKRQGGRRQTTISNNTSVA